MMLIREVCEAASVTKKAVEYYIEQKLIDPGISENGYRDFSDEDIGRLKKIAVLRKLGLSIEEIRTALADSSGESMQRLSVRGSIRLKQEADKQALLDRLSVQRDWTAVKKQIESLEKTMTVAEKLLEAFPGYYGRFISLHFAGFLNQPIETREQQEAYEAIVQFLDCAPAMILPVEVQDYLSECTKDIGTQAMTDMNEEMKRSLADMEAFLSENKDTLEWYTAYRKSEEYRKSPAYWLQSLLKEFNMTSGYYEAFIPVMKKLSPIYAAYYERLEKANEKLMRLRPDIAEALTDG